MELYQLDSWYEPKSLLLSWKLNTMLNRMVTLTRPSSDDKFAPLFGYMMNPPLIVHVLIVKP